MIGSRNNEQIKQTERNGRAGRAWVGLGKQYCTPVHYTNINFKRKEGSDAIIQKNKLNDSVNVRFIKSIVITDKKHFTR